MQNFAYSTFGLVPPSRQTKRQVLLHGHENDPPERVIGLGSGEHSFSKMSFLVFPGLGAGGLHLALGAYRRCGRAAATTGRGAAAGGVSAATAGAAATIAIVTPVMVAVVVTLVVAILVVILVLVAVVAPAKP